MRMSRHPMTAWLLSGLCFLPGILGAASWPGIEPPEDAQRASNGLATKMLKEGNGGAPPDANDHVAVHLQGWTQDGREFINSRASGRPRVLKMPEIFPAWRQAMSLTGLEESRRVWIPEHLAPKSTGGPEGPTVIDVELIAVLRIPNPPFDNLKKPPPDAERTPGGAFTKVREAGTGKVRPTPGSGKVLAHYTAFAQDGRVFDTTMSREKPTLFLLDRVPLGIGDCLERMVEGERRLCWLPPTGEAIWPNAPPGMLIFELHAVQITP